MPIFESVEPDWFRRANGSGTSGRHSAAGIEPVSGAGRAEARNAGNWTSPGDEGWRSAEAVQVPISGGTTEAGLPKRVPRANLVPGSAGRHGGGAFHDVRHRARAREPATVGAVRSAQEIGERLANFQRGARAGHAAGRIGQLAAGEEEWEDNA